MEAKFAMKGHIMVVELIGRLDFESTEPFRRTCLEKLMAERVIFDLRNLNFVGSLGLTEFVSTLDNLKKVSRPGVRFCGVSSEFRRLFEANGFSPQEMFDNQEKAIQSFAFSI